MDFNPIFLSNDLSGANKQVKLMNTSYLFSDIIRVLIDEHPVQNDMPSDENSHNSDTVLNLNSEDQVNSDLIINLQNLFNISFKDSLEKNNSDANTIFTSPQKAVAFIDELINIFEKSGLSLQNILKNSNNISENNITLNQFRQSLLNDLEKNQAVELDLTVGNEKIKIAFNKEPNTDLNIKKDNPLTSKEEIKTNLRTSEKVTKNEELYTKNSISYEKNIDNLSERNKVNEIINKNLYTEKKENISSYNSQSQNTENNVSIKTDNETAEISHQVFNKDSEISPDKKNPEISIKNSSLNNQSDTAIQQKSKTQDQVISDKKIPEINTKNSPLNNTPDATIHLKSKTQTQAISENQKSPENKNTGKIITRQENEIESSKSPENKSTEKINKNSIEFFNLKDEPADENPSLKNNGQVRITFTKGSQEYSSHKEELFLPEKVNTKDQILFKQAKQKIYSENQNIETGKEIIIDKKKEDVNSEKEIQKKTLSKHEEKINLSIEKESLVENDNKKIKDVNLASSKEEIKIKEELSTDASIRKNDNYFDEKTSDGQDNSFTKDKRETESNTLRQPGVSAKNDNEKTHFKTELKELTAEQRNLLHNEINKVNKPDKVFSSHNVLPEKVVKASLLMGELSKIISQGDKKIVTLQLSPENLGKVNITLDVIENNVKANIEVQNESVKQVIQNNSDVLRNSLVQTGLNLQALNVSLYGNENKQGKAVNTKKKLNDLKDEEPIINNEAPSATVKKMGYNTYEFLA